MEIDHNLIFINYCRLRIYMFFASQDPNLFWDLLKNEIWRRSFTKIFTRSHYSKDLRWISSVNLVKIFRRKDFMIILIKTFSSNNLQMIFITFLLKIFLRSLEDLQFKSFGDLWKIFIWYLFEIFWYLF